MRKLSWIVAAVLVVLCIIGNVNVVRAEDAGKDDGGKQQPPSVTPPQEKGGPAASSTESADKTSQADEQPGDKKKEEPVSDPTAARAKMVKELQDRFTALEARRTALLDRMASIETEQLPKTKEALDKYEAALADAENKIPDIVAEVERERAGWLVANLAVVTEALTEFKKKLLAPLSAASATPPAVTGNGGGNH